MTATSELNLERTIPSQPSTQAWRKTIAPSSSARLSIYRSGKCKDWLKFKNPAAPAVKRGGRGLGQGAVANEPQPS